MSHNNTTGALLLDIRKEANLLEAALTKHHINPMLTKIIPVIFVRSDLVTDTLRFPEGVCLG